MAQPAKRRTREAGKTTPPAQGSKADQPKKTSQRTPKEKLRRQTVGLKKIKLNKIIEEPIFYVYSAHRPSGNLGFSHFHPAKKNLLFRPQNPWLP